MTDAVKGVLAVLGCDLGIILVKIWQPEAEQQIDRPW